MANAKTEISRCSSVALPCVQHGEISSSKLYGGHLRSHIWHWWTESDDLISIICSLEQSLAMESEHMAQLEHFFAASVNNFERANWNCQAAKPFHYDRAAMHMRLHEICATQTTAAGRSSLTTNCGNTHLSSQHLVTNRIISVAEGRSNMLYFM